MVILAFSVIPIAYEWWKHRRTAQAAPTPRRRQRARRARRETTP